MAWLVICGFLALLALLAYQRRRRAVPVTVEIDDVGVRRSTGAEVTSVRWDELARIQIVTTNCGPFVEDLFWLFCAADGHICALESGLVDGRLFDHLKALPNVDDMAIITAMGSTDNASFLVWSREPQAKAVDAAQAAQS